MTNDNTKCQWLIQVPSGNPEPSCEADLWAAQECGGAVEFLEDGADNDSWACQYGHVHWTYGSPRQRAEEAAEAFGERMGFDGF